jgi:hypothetical protein
MGSFRKIGSTSDCLPLTRILVGRFLASWVCSIDFHVVGLMSNYPVMVAIDGFVRAILMSTIRTISSVQTPQAAKST